MSKFCTNCGHEVSDGTNYCNNCGASLNDSSQTNNNSTININVNNINNSVHIPNRSIPLAVIFTFLTCGIYGIYWFICLTDEANAVSGENGPSGGVSFLLTLITCGIYGIYWAYKMGQKLHSAGQKHNKPIGDNSILYLVLTIFSLGIVNYCLMQNDLNRFSE